jgi:hypothetical protein
MGKTLEAKKLGAGELRQGDRAPTLHCNAAVTKPFAFSLADE